MSRWKATRGPFITDDGLQVLDCVVLAHADIYEGLRSSTSGELSLVWVEHGLALDLVDEIIVAGSPGITPRYREGG